MREKDGQRCWDTLGESVGGGPLGVYYCHGLAGSQVFLVSCVLNHSAVRRSLISPWSSLVNLKLREQVFVFYALHTSVVIPRRDQLNRVRMGHLLWFLWGFWAIYRIWLAFAMIPHNSMPADRKLGVKTVQNDSGRRSWRLFSRVWFISKNRAHVVKLLDVDWSTFLGVCQLTSRFWPFQWHFSSTSISTCQ